MGLCETSNVSIFTFSCVSDLKFTHVLIATVSISWWGFKVWMEKFVKWWCYTSKKKNSVRCSFTQFIYSTHSPFPPYPLAYAECKCPVARHVTGVRTEDPLCDIHGGCHCPHTSTGWFQMTGNGCEYYGEQYQVQQGFCTMTSYDYHYQNAFRCNLCYADLCHARVILHKRTKCRIQ